MRCLLIGYKYCKVSFSYQAILQKQRGLRNVSLSFLTIQRLKPCPGNRCNSLTHCFSRTSPFLMYSNCIRINAVSRYNRLNKAIKVLISFQAPRFLENFHNVYKSLQQQNTIISKLVPERTKYNAKYSSKIEKPFRKIPAVVSFHNGLNQQFSLHIDMQRDVCTLIYNWMITSSGNLLLSDDVTISWDSAESQARKEIGECLCSWLTLSQVSHETTVVIVFKQQSFKLTLQADGVLQQESAQSLNIS